VWKTSFFDALTAMKNACILCTPLHLLRHHAGPWCLLLHAYMWMFSTHCHIFASTACFSCLCVTVVAVPVQVSESWFCFIIKQKGHKYQWTIFCDFLFWVPRKLMWTQNYGLYNSMFSLLKCWFFYELQMKMCFSLVLIPKWPNNNITENACYRRWSITSSPNCQKSW
jgi:hypothetical protein